MKLDIVPFESIEMGERFREDLGAVEKLAESLKQNGFINPLTVKRKDSSSYLLIAGGRRLTAAGLAGISAIPVRIYDRDLAEDELRAIELEENIQRKDLSWQEKVKLQKEINDLRIQIHGEKTSTSPDAPGWSMRDTAKLLGHSVGKVSGDIKLARAVEELTDIDWDLCKTQSEATKMLNRLEETMIKRELSKRAEKTRATGSLKARQQQLIDCYVLGDFFEKAKKLKPETFNFAEVDPPYAVNLQKIAKHGSKIIYHGNHADDYNEIAAESYQAFLATTLEHCYRLLAPDSWMIFWFANEPWQELVYDEICRAGFQTTRRAAVWTKSNGRCSSPNNRLASAYESFYWCWKGKPTLAKRGHIDVFRFDPENVKQKIHPTERPRALIKEILSIFAWPNARVLVPFAGSGNTLRAAYDLEMHPIGYDLTHQYREAYIVRVMEGE